MITGKDPISLQVLEAFTQKQKLATIAQTFNLSLDQVKRLKRLFNYTHTVQSIRSQMRKRLSNLNSPVLKGCSFPLTSKPKTPKP